MNITSNSTFTIHEATKAEGDKPAEPTRVTVQGDIDATYTETIECSGCDQKPASSPPSTDAPPGPSN